MQVIRIALLLTLAFSVLRGQSTQGVIAGRIFDQETGAGIQGAKVECTNLTSGTRRQVETSPFGYYWLSSLSPGTYSVAVSSEGFVARMAYNVTLLVAGFADLDFPMRPGGSDYASRRYAQSYLPGSDAVVHVYAADLQTTLRDPLSALQSRSTISEGSQSYFLTPEEIQHLPWSGRDVYAGLTLQPNITSQAAIARGLSFAPGGQRPTSTNYLLDGASISDPFVTGPLAVLGPEGIRELRMSVGTWTAEYGGSAGLLANAVTRSGADSTHAMFYLYGQHEALRARDAVEKQAGWPERPFREVEAGVSAGGRLWRALYGSIYFDALRFRSRRDPETFTMPTRAFLDRLRPESAAAMILRPFAEALPDAAADTATLMIAPSFTFDRTLLTPRIDYVGGDMRWMARVSVADLNQPDLVFSPYRNSSSPFDQTFINASSTVTWTGTPERIRELRVTFGRLESTLNPPASGLPLLRPPGVSIPGAESAFATSSRARDWEASWIEFVTSGRHFLRFGGSYLFRRINATQQVAPSGLYDFASLQSFAEGRPLYLRSGVLRETDSDPPGARSYRYGIASAFVQNSIRVNRRLTIGLGLRWEYHGEPVSDDSTPDYVVQWGAESESAIDRLRGASLERISGERAVFDGRQHRWGPRVSFSYSLTPRGSTVLRGAYGIFYDRIFDNFWLNSAYNSIYFPLWRFPDGQEIFFNQPIGTAIGQAESRSDVPILPLIGIASDLHGGRAHNAFVSLQRALTPGLWFELTGSASRGRELLTTDRINRFATLPRTFENSSGRVVPEWEDVLLRANQGESDYYSGTALLRFRTDRFSGQAAYTWSHAIDIQSDPLAREFSDLNFLRSSRSGSSGRMPLFTRQGMPGLDRGNADFDQRHNLVFFATMELPAWRARRFGPVLSRWRIGALGALRSGGPYTVYAASSESPIIFNRADLISPGEARIEEAVPGGKRLLNPAAFATPAGTRVGNTGRNAFRGPGQFSADLSVSRSFGLRVGDRPASLTLRADIFNFLNHANLGNPAVTSLPRPGFPSEFGIARYGRRGQASGVPAELPLTETPRRIQVMLRFEF